MSQELHKEPIANSAFEQLDIQALIAATKALQPKKAPLDDTFGKLYPFAKDALERRGLTRKELLAMWAKNGFKLHPTKFKELYNAEAKRRGDEIDGSQV